MASVHKRHVSRTVCAHVRTLSHGVLVSAARIPSLQIPCAESGVQWNLSHQRRLVGCHKNKTRLPRRILWMRRFAPRSTSKLRRPSHRQASQLERQQQPLYRLHFSGSGQGWAFPRSRRGQAQACPLRPSRLPRKFTWCWSPSCPPRSAVTWPPDCRPALLVRDPKSVCAGKSSLPSTNGAQF